MANIVNLKEYLRRVFKDLKDILTDSARRSWRNFMKNAAICSKTARGITVTGIFLPTT